MKKTSKKSMIKKTKGAESGKAKLSKAAVQNKTGKPQEKLREMLLDGNLKSHKPVVAESSRDIEESYAREKRKIDDAMRKLESERLREYLNLANSKKSLIELNRENLNELEKNLQSHAHRIKAQIDSLKKNKVDEKSHFDRLYLLNEHLKKIESQSRDLAISRKILLKKEKDLLSDIKKFFNENQNEIRHYGMDKVEDIHDIVDKKTKILAETAHLLNEDLNSLFSDKKLLEKITDKQLDKIYRINNALKKLEKDHRTLLERRQELKTKEFEFKQMLDDIDNKRASLVKKLKKISRK